ncbi:MAG: cytochrome c oxidase subunit II [Actinomycetia bacterium]|nr:cytochrome c oxidase subunit II [Actinomycetes bacterium]MCH9800998.1 cytochrome c oxidase subunit II [Actinomycetes bacterium]
MLVATGCSARETLFIGIPEPATEEGILIEDLWEGAWVAAWPVGMLVWGLMIVAIILFARRKRSGIPEQTAYNLPLEVMYTVAPLIMIFGLFWFAARDGSEILSVDKPSDHTVNVVGFRWSWAFNYVEEDTFEIGTPQDDPMLWLPVDEPVRIDLTSPDVIHSFWVPAWLFKKDVIPGKMNSFIVTPNKQGEFVGKCAELCGVDHSRMLFDVKVVPRAEFEAHMEDLRAAGNSGQLETGRVGTSGVPGVEGRTSE